MILVDKQYRGIRFEVHARSFAGDLQSFDGDVLLVCQAEADYVKHRIVEERGFAKAIREN